MVRKIKLGKEIKKDVFSSYHKRGTKKKYELRNRPHSLWSLCGSMA